MINHKTELRGKEFVKIDKFYLSSKTSLVSSREKHDLKVANRYILVSVVI